MVSLMTVGWLVGRFVPQVEEPLKVMVLFRQRPLLFGRRRWIFCDFFGWVRIIVFDPPLFLSKRWLRNFRKTHKLAFPLLPMNKALQRAA